MRLKDVTPETFIHYLERDYLQEKAQVPPAEKREFLMHVLWAAVAHKSNFQAQEYQQNFAKYGQNSLTPYDYIQAERGDRRRRRYYSHAGDYSWFVYPPAPPTSPANSPPNTSFMSLAAGCQD